MIKGKECKTGNERLRELGAFHLEKEKMAGREGGIELWYQFIAIF